MAQGVLQLEKVSKIFSCNGTVTRVLDNISMSFSQGLSYAIMGVSGTGKSTLLHILSGVDIPTQGTVLLHGIQVSTQSQISRSQSIAKLIGVSFQNPYLIAELTALENVALAGLVVGDLPQVAYERANTLLTRLQIEHKGSLDVLTLSGGQQQRVALARALYHTPQFLIADEPTGSLDEQSARVVIDLIASFCTEFGVGVIISTHDAAMAEKMQYRYKLHNGALETC